MTYKSILLFIYSFIFRVGIKVCMEITAFCSEVKNDYNQSKVVQKSRLCRESFIDSLTQMWDLGITNYLKSVNVNVFAFIFSSKLMSFSLHEVKGFEATWAGRVIVGVAARRSVSGTGTGLEPLSFSWAHKGERTVSHIPIAGLCARFLVGRGIFGRSWTGLTHRLW